MLFTDHRSTKPLNTNLTDHADQRPHDLSLPTKTIILTYSIDKRTLCFIKRTTRWYYYTSRRRNSTSTTSRTHVQPAGVTVRRLSQKPTKSSRNTESWSAVISFFLACKHSWRASEKVLPSLAISLEWTTLVGGNIIHSRIQT
jgi:hypothetical protein